MRTWFSPLIPPLPAPSHNPLGALAAAVLGPAFATYRLSAAAWHWLLRGLGLARPPYPGPSIAGQPAYRTGGAGLDTSTPSGTGAGGGLSEAEERYLQHSGLPLRRRRGGEEYSPDGRGRRRRGGLLGLAAGAWAAAAAALGYGLEILGGVLLAAVMGTVGTAGEWRKLPYNEAGNTCGMFAAVPLLCYIITFAYVCMRSRCACSRVSSQPCWCAG